MKTNYNYLFGPVPSRRLGRSLGIDVTPHKTCSFDCLYCQCGATAQKTDARDEYVALRAVCAELEQWLAEGGEADVITFAGSGEPTLYSRLGELIAFIRSKTRTPIIVLSNGTLLHRPDVRAELQGADVVKMTLSAWDEASFQAIHRPAAGVGFEQLLAGARAFRASYSGELWLEVFLIEGRNSAPEQVRQIAEIAQKIGPDHIHLNTAVRPAAESAVRPMSAAQLQVLSREFTPRAEVIASFRAPAAEAIKLNARALAGLIHRHPATSAQLAALSGATASAIEAALAPLLAAGELQIETRNGERWYK